MYEDLDEKHDERIPEMDAPVPDEDPADLPPEIAEEQAAQAMLRESGETLVKVPPDEDEPAPMPSEFPKPRPRKAPDVPQIERKNWLLHYHFMRKEAQTCKSLIKEQLDETSDSCEYALYVKGLILRQEGKIQESLDILQQCAMLNPQNVEYVKQIARSLFLLGKQKNALDVLNEALKINEDDPEVHYWKGLCYYHTQDNQNAKDSLQQALKLGKHERTMLLLGKIFSEEGDLMKAIEAYRRALELSPENPDILTKLGLLYLKTDSFQQAFEALGRALSFDQSHSGAILAAGSMMQQHGDFDVALTKYRVAAQEMPDNAQLWSNIAMCFYGKKKFVAAISCLKRANYLAPFDWKILYNLGLVHLGMSQYASAFHFISAAININPKVASLFMTLAVTLTNLEDTKNAGQAYEHALELDKRDPTIALNYAIFLLKQREKTKATEWFSNFEARLHNVRDQKTGQLRIDTEVLEMAERFRNIMATGGDMGGTSETASRPPTTTPAHLKRDEFDSDQISLPPPTAGSSGGSDRAGLSTGASRQTSLTVSAEPKLSMDSGGDTASTMTLSSRFNRSEEFSSNV